jgi:glycosyltransferase involved in cell wall biosynthesis
LPHRRRRKKKIRKELNVPYKRVIVSVGQFIYRKGFDILLNAALLLPEDAGIYIIGGQPSEEYLTFVGNHNLNNIHFIPYKEKNELYRYYQCADLFVLPTRYDIWGLVVNEAMANGLPVITSNKCVAGTEMVQSGINGFLYDAKDSKKLAELILELLNNEAFLKYASKRGIKTSTQLYFRANGTKAYRCFK